MIAAAKRAADGPGVFLRRLALGGLMSGLDHGRGEELVGFGPGGVRGGRPGGAEALGERGEEGGADGGVVLIFHAVTGVADAELAHGWEKLVESVEAAGHEAEHADEFFALGAHVAVEKAPQGGIEGEEFGVEKGGGGVGFLGGGGESGTDEGDFVGRERVVGGRGHGRTIAGGRVFGHGPNGPCVQIARP